MKKLFVEYSGSDKMISAWVDKGDETVEYIKSKKKAEYLMYIGKLIDRNVWSGETFASLLLNYRTRKYGRNFIGEGWVEVYDLGS